MSATSSAGLPAGTQKPAARAIMFALEADAAALLRDCFRQFGVDAIPEEDRTGARLQREKFEACVVALDDPMASQTMQAARTSTSNQRIVSTEASRAMTPTKAPFSGSQA